MREPMIVFGRHLVQSSREFRQALMKCRLAGQVGGRRLRNGCTGKKQTGKSKKTDDDDAPEVPFPGLVRAPAQRVTLKNGRKRSMLRG